jgi:hypothetical protein
MTVDLAYERSIKHGLEYVHVIAARRGWDTRKLHVVFDDGREPAKYQEHTLVISILDTDCSVMAQGIPHQWIEIGTGFIDIRFSQRIAALLSDLERKATAGQFP